MIIRLCDPIKTDFKCTGNIQLMLQVMFQHSVESCLLYILTVIT